VEGEALRQRIFHFVCFGFCFAGAGGLKFPLLLRYGSLAAMGELTFFLRVEI
jgi:hypothetical protein